MLSFIDKQGVIKGILSATVTCFGIC